MQGEGAKEAYNFHQKTIFVVGHQRPDTDAAVSAAVCASFKQRLDSSHHYIPLIQGELNQQSRWLFEKAKVPIPALRHDIRPTVGEAMAVPPITVSPDTTLEEAIGILREKRISMVPVVEPDGRLLGIVSDRVQENQYFYHFNIEHAFGELITLEELKKAFDLKHIGGPVATPHHGSIRVASHTPSSFAAALTPNDVVLMADSAELFDTAARAKVAAIILADCSLEHAQRMSSRFPELCVYHYSGSLLVLISDLPMAIPVHRVMVTPAYKLRAEDPLESCKEVLSSATYALPVVDSDEKVMGVLSAKNAFSFPMPRVILVDHFERAQTISGIHAAEILEIIDHHRIGNIETAGPIRVDCRPVGSTSTILACQMQEAGIEPTQEEAILLLGALVSDTLLLTSPTTTEVDKRVAPYLAKQAQVDLQEFGRHVLKLNDELATGYPEALVEKDLKEFTQGKIRFAVAQLETVDISLLTEERKAELVEALEHARRKLGVEFAVLMITDVFQSLSHVVIADPMKERAKKMLDGADPKQGKRFEGMVSRKKQTIPWIFSHLPANGD